MELLLQGVSIGVGTQWRRLHIEHCAGMSTSSLWNNMMLVFMVLMSYS